MVRAFIFAIFALISVSSAAADYKVDMTAVRHLADQMPGDKPAEIRVEKIGYFPFSWDEVVDGAEKAPVQMTLMSYQLVWPDRTALIDVTEDKATFDQDQAQGWDQAASDRLDAGMGKADIILVTHEHSDHIGRIVTRATDKAFLAHVKLTREQVDNPDRMIPLTWPEGALTGYQPLVYDGMTAIAPGVVAIKAPGHTPGSQLIFVKTAAGKEILFLGDAVWQWRNIAEGKSRAASAVAFLHEDDAAVKAELAEFQRLVKDEPSLVLVPGHDGDHVAKLIADGTFVAHFQ